MRSTGMTLGDLAAARERLPATHVFDLWADRWRRREAPLATRGGDVIIVRYADDIVVGFQHEADARRFWDAMRTRFEAFALSARTRRRRA
jgi:RNA-directed DNA polymerase